MLVHKGNAETEIVLKRFEQHCSEERIVFCCYSLLLRSLKAITKESPVVAVILRRSTPNPRIGATVELSGGDARGLLNLIGIGKTLSC
jgi:hypothetical protein